jgi:glycosyltransferase involved in cell wall biosynthesis
MRTQHDPEVTFVVLCYNHARFIGECLDSILGQRGSFRFEVVVVDDASSDDSASVLRRYRDPRIRVIRHERNQGHGRTVEDGLRAARGTFVARIDGDDRYKPGYLEAVVPVLRDIPSVGLVYGNVDLIDDRGTFTQVSIDEVHGQANRGGDELLRLLEKNFICAPTVIARREAWLQALPVPSGLAFHDWYFTVMIARRWQLFHHGEILADYRVHPGNLHTAIVLNRTEEPSIFRVLDTVFAEANPTTPLGRALRRSRRRIYGAHHLTLARKYFGAGMTSDARRSYVRAIAYRPAYIADWSVSRQCFGAIVGQRAYTKMKALVRGATA